MISYYNFNELLKAAGINGQVEAWGSTLNHAYRGRIHSSGNNIFVKDKGLAFKAKWANNPNRTHLPIEVSLWLKRECGINLFKIDKRTLEILDSQGTGYQIPMTFTFKELAEKIGILSLSEAN